MIRVLIADDHPVVRGGIRQVLEAAGNIVVAAEAADGDEVLQRMRVGTYDVVLLDLSMPGIEAFTLLHQLRRDWPAASVLILTMHSEEQFAVRAWRAGASGYLTKDAVPEELVQAIGAIAAGGRYVSEHLATHLANHHVDGAATLAHEKLSNREYQVFRMIADGQPTRKISETLGVSVKTVSTYRARIFLKMDVQSPAELAAYAVRHKLVK